jgi:hypothetical protein
LILKEFSGFFFRENHQIIARNSIFYFWNYKSAIDSQMKNQMKKPLVSGVEQVMTLMMILLVGRCVGSFPFLRACADPVNAW